MRNGDVFVDGQPEGTIEFLRRAKALRPDTVRMTLSGYTDLQSIIDAVNEGAVYKFLTKPWDDARLREHVAQAFRVTELAEENHRLAHEITSANTELADTNRRLKCLAEREHERVDAMTGATDAARALVDLMPVAVFGFDPEGWLVYVNRTAFDWLPAWAGGLGAQPDGDLLAALQRAQQSPQAAVPVESHGRLFEASVKVLSAAPDQAPGVVPPAGTEDARATCGVPASAQRSPLGTALMLMAHPLADARIQGVAA